MTVNLYDSIKLLLRDFRNFWVMFSRNKVAVTCLIIIVVLLFVAVLAPIIAPHDPLETRRGPPLTAPSLEYPMGTDDLGRDIFTGVVWGSRVSLMVGFTAAGMAAIIGILVGAIAGYYGGMPDDILMRVAEFFLIFPTLFLAIVIVAFWGSSLWTVTITIAVLRWPSTARLMRGEFLRLKEKEFVEASRSVGERDLSIIFSEIAPNGLPPIIVNTSLEVATAILLEAGISFLGLGDPNLLSWGMMIYNAQLFLQQAWWMALFPGLAIMITASALNQLGDSLNDALNPRLKGRSL
jgi:peptide/nickel transport system permease protein